MEDNETKEPTQETNTPAASSNGSNEKFQPIVEMIVKACCDEYTAEFQYIMAEHVARGNNYMDAAGEYKAHAEEEHGHLLKWLKRLEQLGVQLDYAMEDFATKGNSWTPIKSVQDIPKQLEILIKAEKDAQTFYYAIVEKARELGDWITEKLAKETLADECEHETDLTRISEEF